MDQKSPSIDLPEKPKHRHPFRKAVLSGLGVVVPPLLTVLIFVWVISTTYRYVLAPVHTGVRETLVWAVADVREDLPGAKPGERIVTVDDTNFYRMDNGTFVPQRVYEVVRRNQGDQPLPETGKGVYRRFVEVTYLRPYYAIPFFLSVFILLLYLLGKFMAAGIGRFFWHRFERLIHRLPLVSNVYGSVKQVSDFMFVESEIEYTRVVAVEYPRKGIWTTALVTGESMLDIRNAAGEPVLSVLIPTSPMPFTGFTITVLKSEAIDLNITIDQAFQFIVSCGVVVPPHQLQAMAEPAMLAGSGANGNAFESPDAPRPTGRQ